jgi:hypothetical protein
MQFPSLVIACSDSSYLSSLTLVTSIQFLPLSSRRPPLQRILERATRYARVTIRFETFSPHLSSSSNSKSSLPFASYLPIARSQQLTTNTSTVSDSEMACPKCRAQKKRCTHVNKPALEPTPTSMPATPVRAPSKRRAAGAKPKDSKVRQ